MKYLQNTITLTLTLEADDLRLIHWWIDGAFATHQDMRSHTGGAMTLGKGQDLWYLDTSKAKHTQIHRNRASRR